MASDGVREAETRAAESCPHHPVAPSAPSPAGPEGLKAWPPLPRLPQCRGQSAESRLSPDETQAQLPLCLVAMAGLGRARPGRPGRRAGWLGPQLRGAHWASSCPIQPTSQDQGEAARPTERVTSGDYAERSGPRPPP